MSECEYEIEILDEEEVIPVLQGQPGERGPPGSAGGSRYTHTQGSAASTWTVNHNMGVRPAAVAVLSPGGVEVEATVTHISLNQLIITFAAPYAGTAEII